MIFLTVGTQFPFDRLVRTVDEVCENGFREEIFAQIGDTSYKPRNFKSVASLSKNMFDKYLKSASGVISHAGMGVITMALDNKKPLLAMPRLKKYGEVVNNHQVAIARKFEKLGHILSVYSMEELPEKLQQLKAFVPKPRENQAQAVANRIARFLQSLTNESVW